MESITKDVAKAGSLLATPSSTPLRITLVELSHELLGSNTVRTKYKAGYAHFTVTSRFTGDKPLSEALFEIIQRKQ